MDDRDTGSVWDILGIEPNADSKAIRAAYAEKAKEFHPEDDPEGFIHLRAAYETALQISPKKHDLQAVPRYDMPVAPSQAGYGGQDRPETQIEIPGPEHNPISMLLDFTDVDQHVADLLAEEKHMADSLIERLVFMRDFEHTIVRGAWIALLESPEMEALKHNKYFVTMFLARFSIMRQHLVIPSKFNKKILLPLIKEWREYWLGTALSIKCEAEWQAYISLKKEIKRDKRKEAGCLLVASLIILAIIALQFSLLAGIFWGFRG